MDHVKLIIFFRILTNIKHGVKIGYVFSNLTINMPNYLKIDKKNLKIII